MPNENLSILIRAILEKSSKSQIETELKNIEKNLKPIVIKTSTNAAKGQFKVLEDGSRELQKVVTNTNNAIGKQVQTIAKVDGVVSTLTSDMGKFAAWLAIGETLITSLRILKESLVDVEVGMKGLETVLPTISGDQEAYNKASNDAIGIMQKYGSTLDDTMTSARSFGRMYKQVETVMGLVNNATLLNVIDSVELESAVKGNEVALSTYGDALKTTNEVLAFSGKLMDSITNLSHNTLASGTDLVNILQQTSSAAKQAGTDLDQLMGLGSAAVRATGLAGQGGNVGRALRTVFTQLSAPSKDVEKEINDIGVSLRDLDTGKLRSAYDIILDLSLATKDASLSQEELNEAIIKASSGKFQYNKLSALVGQFDEIVKNTAISINSQGKTMEMAAQQMDTISRKAGMLKATLIDMFSGVGDSGLRTTVKGFIDGLDQFLIGLNTVDPKVYQFGMQLLGVVAVYKTFMGVSSFIAPMLLTMGNAMQKLGIVTKIAAEAEVISATASGIDAVAKTAEATATTKAAVAQEALNISMAKNPITLLIVGLTALAGTALYQYISKMGEATKANKDLEQAQQDELTKSQQQAGQMTSTISYLNILKDKRKELTDAINSGKLSTENLAAAQGSLKSIDEAIMILADGKTRAQMKANGVTEKEIQLIIDSAITSKTAAISKIKDQKDMADATVEATGRRIKALETEIALMAQIAGNTPVNKASFLSGLPTDKQSGLEGMLQSENNLLDAQQQKAKDLASAFASANGEIEGLKNIPNGGGGGDSISSSSSSKEDTYITDQYQKSLSALNSQLEILEFNKSKLSSTSQEYRDIIQQEISLLKQQQDLAHNQADTLRYKIASGGLDQKEIDDTNKTIQDLGNTWVDLQKKINDNNFEVATSQIGQFDQKVSDLGYELESLKIDEKGLISGTSAYNNNQKAQINITDQMIQAKKEEITTYKSLIQSESLSAKQKEELIATCKKLKNELKDLQVTNSDYSDAIYQSIIAEVKKTEQAKLDAQKNTLDAEIETINAQIDAYQSQIDALEKVSDLEDEILERQKRQLEIQKLQLELDNTLKEKNKKVLTKQSDGSWDWVWSVDVQKVEELNDSIRNEQEDFNQWEINISRKHAKEILQNQIDADRKLIDEKQKAYDKIVDDYNQGMDLLESRTAENYATLNSNISSYWDTIIETVKTKMATMLAEQAKLNNIVAVQTTTISNNSYNEYVATGDKSVFGVSLADMTAEEARAAGFASGGETQSTGLQLLHGKPGEPERVLSSQQTKSFNKLVDYLPNLLNKINLLSNLSIPKLNIPNLTIANANSGGSPVVYNISGVTVKANNGEQFISSLTNMVNTKNR